MAVMENVIIRTIVPILLLMGAGFLSRRTGILKAGDERVLSAYIYYFALPALFLVTMVETSFTSDILAFMLAGILPVFVVLAVYALLYVVFRFSRNTFYLLILTTIFGSLAFFGIPFIRFAFPVEGERLATLAAAFIAMVSVTTSLVVLELYRLEESTKWGGVKKVVRRLSRNPLIISILLGVFLSLIGVEVPAPLSDSLHMLGGTTSVVALFMLGVFIYGRRYTRLGDAFKLSLLRMLFLPVVAFLATRLIGIAGIEGSVLVLMHGTPIAISMIILSERYDFFKETIASLILISSLAASFYLNLWLLLLGYY